MHCDPRGFAGVWNADHMVVCDLRGRGFARLDAPAPARLCDQRRVPLRPCALDSCARDALPLVPHPLCGIKLLWAGQGADGAAARRVLLQIAKAGEDLRVTTFPEGPSEPSIRTARHIRALGRDRERRGGASSAGRDDPGTLRSTGNEHRGAPL